MILVTARVAAPDSTLSEDFFVEAMDIPAPNSPIMFPPLFDIKSATPGDGLGIGADMLIEARVEAMIIKLEGCI
jgi:hypothetical protein